MSGTETLSVKHNYWPRRKVIQLGGAAALCAVSNLNKQAQAQTRKAIRFGLTPVFLTNDLELLNALKSFLTSETGYEIELITRRTYQEITALLVSGNLDAAWICGYPFVRYRDQLELVAVPQWNGKPLYQSYLIVGANRDVDEIEDLIGDIHAFSDPDSNSGYLVTRALLFERGLDPALFFRKTMFTYEHRNVIRAVGSSLAQSGSVDGYVWEVMRETEPELIKHTKIFRKSEWMGFPPIATSKALAHSPKISALTSAFMSMEQNPVGADVLKLLRLTRFGPAEPTLFDGIAEKVAALEGVL